MNESQFNPVNSLVGAMKAVFSDRMWLVKVAFGGLAMLTMIGIVLPYGFLVEHLDNSRRGFRSPLPPWRQFGDKAIMGMLALIFDFAYFILPIIMAVIVLLCAIFPVFFSNNVPSFGAWLAGFGLVLIWMFGFILSLSPISHINFAYDGDIEQHLGRKTIRHALNPLVRGLYLRARLITLPLYIPVALAAVQLWFTIGSSGSSVLQLIGFTWLFTSLVFLAWLIIDLVYLDAVMAAEDRLLDARLAARQT